MAKRGRPKKDDAKKYYINIRLTESEYLELMMCCRLSKSSISDYIRNSIESANDKIREKHKVPYDDGYYEDGYDYDEWGYYED